VLLNSDAKSPSRDYSTLPYLIKDYQMVYNYSATLFLEHKQKDVPAEEAAVTFLGFAPDFGESLSGRAESKQTAVSGEKAVLPVSLRPLKGAKEEVKNIATLFRGNYFLDSTATKYRFRKEAPYYSILHLATHALVNDSLPAYSGLAFAKQGKQEDSRFLYAYELYNLKLKADLVVLSACNTGYGKIQKGEGVMSLARGFAYAGCPTIVVSLWPAVDKPTASIMQRFYRGIHEGLTKDEALHHAKLQYLKTSDARLANPYLWANLVLIGDSAPLHQSSSSPFFWLAILIAGLLSTIGVRMLWNKTRRKKLDI
jgi:CHAT domain-containing protein